MFTMKLYYYLAIFGGFCVVSVICQPPPCTTPNGENAVCKSLFSCPILKSAVSLGDPTIERFIEASAAACGTGTLLVCCGTSANYTCLNNVTVTKNPSIGETPTTLESQREYALKHLLPSRTYCGMQHADDYFRDYNTSETTVDELPWVMFVSCENSDGPIAASWSSDRDFASTSRDCDCSGVLISKRYVLTASNCASAKWVGLGQREQYKEVSCTATPFGDDCSEVGKTPFTEQIRHPNTTLLLLRLNKKITFTDYVRPICLPLGENERLEIGEVVTTPKWTIDNKVRGFVRTKLNQTITSNDECSVNFRTLKLQNPSNYLCNRMEDDETVICKTDSGAPIMYKRNNNWLLGGILHAGQCIEKTTVANQITPEIVNWILDNIKP